MEAAYSDIHLLQDIVALISRWKAGDHARKDHLYCIASTQELSFSIQRQLSTAIDSAMFSSLHKSPLLLVSGATERQHLVAQYNHFRHVFPLLPISLCFICQDNCPASSCCQATPGYFVPLKCNSGARSSDTQISSLWWRKDFQHSHLCY